jgi:hypothetical protein
VGYRGEVGLSAWNGIALARLVASDGAALRHDLLLLLTALGRAAVPRLWLNQMVPGIHAVPTFCDGSTAVALHEPPA